MTAHELSLHLLADGPDANTGSFYGMVTAIVVALIVAIGGYFQQRSTRRTPTMSKAAQRKARHCEAVELWLVMHTDADPRKIQTGYESLEEVRRVNT